MNGWQKLTEPGSTPSPEEATCVRMQESETLLEDVHLFLADVSLSLGISTAEACEILGTEPAARSDRDRDVSEAITRFSDETLRRRSYTPAIVNGFYTGARRGEGGESTFVGGAEGLALHSYPRDAIERLDSSAKSRFLGLGNVWRGVSLPVDQSVVDVGCGAGVDLAVAAYLSDGSAELLGVDKRDDLFEVAQSACPGATFALAEIESLSLGTSKFDLVLANGLPPLQRPHTLVETAERLHELTRVGGVVSATVLVTAPEVADLLQREFRSQPPLLSDTLATLLTGKPTAEAVRAAFGSAGGSAELSFGENPYRAEADRTLTAMVEVVSAHGQSPRRDVAG